MYSHRRRRIRWPENRRVHDLLTGGVSDVVYTEEHDGIERNPTARLVDFRGPGGRTTF